MSTKADLFSAASVGPHVPRETDVEGRGGRLETYLGGKRGRLASAVLHASDLCMWVCTEVHMNACTEVHTYIRIHTCMHTYTYMHIKVDLRPQVHIHAYIGTYIH